MCTRSLSTVDKLAGFLKTPVSLECSDLHFNIVFSEKRNSSSVHLQERKREAVYEWITTIFAAFLY